MNNQRGRAVPVRNDFASDATGRHARDWEKRDLKPAGAIARRQGSTIRGRGLTHMTVPNRSIFTALATGALFISAVPAFVAGLSMNSTPAKAQDMSNGADNFYKSDKVSVQKVAFKNQYQMTVAGNLFIPRGLN